MDEYKMKIISCKIVKGLVGKELADKWWNSPNLAFDNRTPAGMWISDPDRVYRYLISISQGEW